MSISQQRKMDKINITRSILEQHALAISLAIREGMGNTVSGDIVEITLKAPIGLLAGVFEEMVLAQDRIELRKRGVPEENIIFEGLGRQGLRKLDHACSNVLDMVSRYFGTEENLRIFTDKCQAHLTEVRERIKAAHLKYDLEHPETPDIVLPR